MIISPQLRMNLNKVAVITIVYILINIFFFFFTYSIINSPYSIGPSLQFSIKSSFFISIIIGLISGVLGGIILVSVNSQLFRKRSFKFSILTTISAYTLIFLIVTIVVIFINIIGEYGLNEISYESIKYNFALMIDPSLITFFIFWGFITLSTLFLLQVNDKFGPGVLLKFLTGNYHHAKKEQRIFMFMDMRSSTSIAEKIGNENYFNLLNDLFSDNRYDS